MKTIIIGAGGHGKVVMDVLQKCNHAIIAFLDDDVKKHNKIIYDLPVLGGVDLVDKFSETLPMGVVVAVGDNLIRENLFNRIRSLGFDLIKAVHPKALVHERVEIGEGTVVMGGSIINIDARIGENCIVNTGALIDHDCVIGNHVHVAPGARLAGGVKVGDRTLIGVGAVVLPEVKIGKDVKIGAGSVVIRDIPDNKTVVGVPARVIEK